LYTTGGGWFCLHRIIRFSGLRCVYSGRLHTELTCYTTTAI
jgi:hypothetical protein